MKNIKPKKYLIISVIALLILFSLFYFEYKNNKAEKNYLLGKAYENQGYFEEAKDAYQKSAKLKPNSIVYNALGNL